MQQSGIRSFDAMQRASSRAMYVFPQEFTCCVQQHVLIIRPEDQYAVHATDDGQIRTKFRCKQAGPLFPSVMQCMGIAILDRALDPCDPDDVVQQIVGQPPRTWDMPGGLHGTCGECGIESNQQIRGV